MNSRSEFSVAGRTLLYCGALVLTIGGLRAASPVVVMILVAVFITIIAAPVLEWLQRRMPYQLALTLVLLMLIGLFLGLPLVIGGSLQQTLRSLPALQSQLQSLGASVSKNLPDELGVSLDELAPFDTEIASGWLGAFLNGLIRVFKDGVLVLVMAAFMLTEISWFSEKLAVIDVGSGEGAKRVAQILENVRRYVGIKTVVSIATGLCIWVGLLVLGVEHAIVWGFVAFLLNYIPSIGSAIAGIPPVLFVLVQDGVGWALAVALLYLAVNTIFGSIIEPRFQGEGLGLSPLIVFVSLIFWGWVFGPVGMLVSAPLTLVVKIALEEFPDTQWIAVLLGGRPGKS